MPQRRLITGVSAASRGCSAPAVTGSGGDLRPASRSSMIRSNFSLRDILIEIVIDLQRWRAGAGADALDFFQRKNAVRVVSLCPISSRFFADSSNCAPPRSMHATLVQNLHVVLAHRLAVQHRVVRQRFFHFHGPHVQALRDLRDHLVADATVLVLLRTSSSGSARCASPDSDFAGVSKRPRVVAIIRSTQSTAATARHPRTV